MKCVACGDHPLNYIHCDRWDCPLLVVRAAIEGDDITPRGYFCGIGGHEHATEADADDCADGRRMLVDYIVCPETRVIINALRGGSSPDEDERDPAPPDEDDDEVAVDWDENGYWPSENDEAEEEEE